MFTNEEIAVELKTHMTLDWKSEFTGTDAEYFLLLTYDIEEPVSRVTIIDEEYIENVNSIDNQLEVMRNANYK